MSNVKKLLFVCRECGDDIEPERNNLGYRLCLLCGEESARQDRRSWTVIQEYTKGAYQFVTPTAVRTALKQTNPKEIRT
jgi:hypothetical protein